jgi:hypothetical protein
MQRRGRLLRRFSLLLAAITLLGLLGTGVSAAYGSGKSFSDVTTASWYYDDVMKCANLGIIDGQPDGKFHPEDSLKRGEFMKLMAVIADMVPMTGAVNHWADPYWKVLDSAGVLWGLDIKMTYADLEKPITRYEMSVMIRNLCFNVFGENAVKLTSPETRIGDYTSISNKYLDAVTQAYGKGILDGYTDGMFHGESTLTRGQAAAVVVRTAWPNSRKSVSFATEIETATGGSGLTNAGDSFAFKYRTMSDYQRRLALFGDGYKTYFTGSEANLGSYIVTIEVPTWYLNEYSGEKTTKIRTLQVNKMVADEVKAIFNAIYNDPERFPIKALGGARFSDTMRHSWGCAIDINPTENYYVNTKTWTALTGSFCYKTSDSPYCIRPGGSVVNAFAKYGWGWGGGTAANNYTGWTTTADYMHFSVLSSGG